MTKRKKKLSDKRRKVVDSYMKCFNKKQSMLDAGYSDSMASTSSAVVFNDPLVRTEIERRQNLASHRSDVSMDWIVSRLKDIADANLGEALDVYSDGSASIDFRKLTPQLKRALTRFSVDERKDGRTGEKTIVATKIGLADQLKALELLMRHLGFSKEKHSVELHAEESLVEALHRGRAQAGMDGGHSAQEDDEE